MTVIQDGMQTVFLTSVSVQPLTWMSVTSVISVPLHESDEVDEPEPDVDEPEPDEDPELRDEDELEDDPLLEDELLEDELLLLLLLQAGPQGRDGGVICPVLTKTFAAFAASLLLG